VPNQVFAQVVTGDVIGTVTDMSGAVVPHVKLTITNLGTKAQRTAASSDAGDYAFNILQPGRYSFRAEASGYKNYVLTSFILGVGDRTRIDVRLELGAATETVEVYSGTIGVLQTDSSTVQDVVSERAVQDLPLNGRNFVGLIQIAPGVNQGLAGSIASGTRPDDRRATSSFSANGQPDVLNNNLIDGLDNNEREQGFIGVRPSIDGIAEVHVMTNDYTAEIGRSTGAVVNVITKAGTNQFHGSAFEFVRNDKFDAQDYYATTTPELRQNQFGGSVGGPILKNKTFFFTDVEWDRVIKGLTYSEIVPTTQEHDSYDFTDISGGTVISPADINAVALRYWKMYPYPTKANATYNYVTSPKQTQYATTFDLRIDHHINDNNTLFGHFSYNPVTTTVPSAFPSVTPSWADGATVNPGGGGSYPGPSQAISKGLHLDYLHIFTPNLILELRTGYTRISIDTKPEDYEKALSDEIGVINGNLGTTETTGLSSISFNDGGAGFGTSAYVPILDHNNTYQYNGMLTWTKRAQTFKFGASFIRRQLNYYQSRGNALGSFQFKTWENFLAGDMYYDSRANLLNLQGFRTSEPSAFAQDDWRINHWLTLNFGVRYDVFTPITEVNNRYANFDLKTLKVIVASSNNRTANVDTYYGDVAPRIGFAAQLPYRMVLRGGYGISYYPGDVQDKLQNPNPPYNYICGSGTCPTTTFPTLPIPTAEANVDLTNPMGDLYYKPSDFKPSYYHQINLVVQKEFAGNVINIGYVGSLGRRLMYISNINRPAPQTTAQASGTAELPYIYATQLPNVGSIQKDDTSGYNSYNSLQTSISRRYHSGLMIDLNYTLAHGLGNALDPSSGGGTSLWTGNPDYDRGNTAVDVRHRIAFSANYVLPFAKESHGLVAYAAQNWQINTIATWQTGLPFSVSNSYSPQINLPGVTSDRPDRYTSVSAWKTAFPTLVNTASIYCLDTQKGPCFGPQAFGTAGNSRQFSDYGPHQRHVDLSLFKDFLMPKEAKLQFRVETFNITNTPNFSSPSTGIGYATFGVTSSTSGNQNPRQIQLALKLAF
jgi:hypothetical protein